MLCANRISKKSRSNKGPMSCSWRASRGGWGSIWRKIWSCRGRSIVWRWLIWSCRARTRISWKRRLILQLIRHQISKIPIARPSSKNSPLLTPSSLNNNKQPTNKKYKNYKYRSHFYQTKTNSMNSYFPWKQKYII